MGPIKQPPEREGAFKTSDAGSGKAPAQPIFQQLGSFARSNLTGTSLLSSNIFAASSVSIGELS